MDLAVEALSALDGCAVESVHPEKVAMVVRNAPTAEEIDLMAGIFKLMGDPTRAKLLYALLEAGELCVCDLAAATEVSEATVSQALRLMRASSVVTNRREGRNMFYRLSDSHVRMLLDLAREHLRHDPARPEEAHR